jgi:hypothetical protein
MTPAPAATPQWKRCSGGCGAGRLGAGVAALGGLLLVPGATPVTTVAAPLVAAVMTNLAGSVLAVRRRR